GGELGEGQGHVGQSDAAAARQGQRRQITEAAAEAERERRRQPRERRRQAARERYAERRRRSRTSSTAIGISESRITMPTTMWMRSLMFGAACPSRGPAHDPRVTHPAPPPPL